MNKRAAAGYYSCILRWGPLPFAFVAVPPDRYLIQQLDAP
jgi:hypothetical protein